MDSDNRASEIASSLDDDPTRPLPLGYILRASDGGIAPIDGPVLIGRAPETEDLGLSGARTLRVGSGSREVSRNHALVIPSHAHVRLFDLRSTNGTMVFRENDTVVVDDTEGVRIEVGELILIGDIEVYFEAFGES